MIMIGVGAKQADVGVVGEALHEIALQVGLYCNVPGPVVRLKPKVVANDHASLLPAVIGPPADGAYSLDPNGLGSAHMHCLLACQGNQARLAQANQVSWCQPDFQTTASGTYMNPLKCFSADIEKSG